MENKKRRLLRASVLTCVVAAGLLVSQQSASAVLIQRDVNVTLDVQDQNDNVKTYDLDVNQDGINDFTFSAAYVADPFFDTIFDTIDVPFASTNAFIVDANTFDGFPTISMLSQGDTVGPAGRYSFTGDQGNLNFDISIIGPATGNFAGQTGFVGLRFNDVNGDLLYGFANVTVGQAGNLPGNLTINSVGFNDAVGVAAVIPTPEPATASLALLGAAGLGMMTRRRRRNA